MSFLKNDKILGFWKQLLFKCENSNNHDNQSYVFKPKKI